jgi:hypothetical protein
MVELPGEFDVLGTAEAAAFLGVEPSRISRWRNRGVVLPDGRRVHFPEPFLTLRATPLWHKGQLQILRDRLADSGTIGSLS